MPMNDDLDADNFMTEMKEYVEETRRKEQPDYRITVYCDKDLGVEMRLADSWSSIEYGETSVLGGCEPDSALVLSEARLRSAL